MDLISIRKTVAGQMYLAAVFLWGQTPAEIVVKMWGQTPQKRAPVKIVEITRNGFSINL